MPVGRHHVTEAWTPRNSNNKYIGMVTLKKALANSINTISAKLMDKVGPEAVVKLTHKLE
jgi:penicillin-binding protein 1A